MARGFDRPPNGVRKAPGADCGQQNTPSGLSLNHGLGLLGHGSSNPRCEERQIGIGLRFGIVISILGTPFANQFYREMEQWVFSNYSGNYADVRVEWSKGWGYTIDAPWTSQTTIKRRIPESLTTGQATEKGFASAVDQLNQLDPFRIYSSPLLDAVFPAKSNTGGSFS